MVISAGGVLLGSFMIAATAGVVHCCTPKYQTGYSFYRVLRNASSARLSSAGRFKPNRWPGMGRAVVPGGLNPFDRKSSLNRAASNHSSSDATEPECSSVSRYHRPRSDGTL